MPHLFLALLRWSNEPSDFRLWHLSDISSRAGGVGSKAVIAVRAPRSRNDHPERTFDSLPMARLFAPVGEKQLGQYIRSR